MVELIQRLPNCGPRGPWGKVRGKLLFSCRI